MESTIKESNCSDEDNLGERISQERNSEAPRKNRVYETFIPEDAIAGLLEVIPVDQRTRSSYRLSIHPVSRDPQSNSTNIPVEASTIELEEKKISQDEDQIPKDFSKEQINPGESTRVKVKMRGSIGDLFKLIGNGIENRLTKRKKNASKQIEPNRIDEGEDIRNQLLSYTRIERFFSHSMYITFCRVRMAYFFIAAFVLLFISIFSFEYSIMFNIVIGDSSNVGASWFAIMIGKLLLAPIVLVGGGWIMQEMMELVIDAFSTEFMIYFRTSVCVFIHFLRHRKEITLFEELKDKIDSNTGKTIQGHSFECPEVDLLTMRFVEFIMPVSFEIITLIYAIVHLITGASLSAFVTSYIAIGIWYALFCGLAYAFIDLLSKKIRKWRYTFLFIVLTTPRVIKNYEMSSVRLPHEIHSHPRVLNPWRYVLPNYI